jgi:hypothetical protein
MKDPPHHPTILKQPRAAFRKYERRNIGATYHGDSLHDFGKRKWVRSVGTLEQHEEAAEVLCKALKTAHNSVNIRDKDKNSA